MPVVGIPVQMLLERLDKPLGRDELVEHLYHLGCDVEGYATVRRFRCRRCDNLVEITETEDPPVVCDRCGADFRAEADSLESLGTSEVVRMELLAVRPDMFEPGGLARVLRNYLSDAPEPPRYQVSPSSWEVVVDASVDSDACKRPAIACAVVRNITLDEDRIKVIMKLQENLHWALGRDRKHASIGVYDLDTLTGPRITYRAVDPDELRFVPLGYDPAQPGNALTPREILQKHPKGVAYARLLSGFQKYPLLADQQGLVLSNPPIINSEETRVRGTTRNFFVDVTGTGERIVNKALNILVTSLVELDPEARIEQVTIRYPQRTVRTPDLSPQEVVLGVSSTARRIGVDLDTTAVSTLLRRMGHQVEALDDDTLKVFVPAYRNDIMHPVDLMEDVAIAYGYHNIEPSLVPTLTVGEPLPIEEAAVTVRRAMTGLGFLEVITLILSNEKANYDALRRPRTDDHVKIENPISVDQTLVRTTLLPGILDTMALNANQPLPQSFFEVGNISRLDPEAETGAVEVRRVAAGIIGPRADYAGIRSACQALLREMAWGLEVEPFDDPVFIPGRGARVIAVREDTKVPLGIMGELHPEVLENHKLVHPAAVMEVDLEPLI